MFRSLFALAIVCALLLSAGGVAIAQDATPEAESISPATQVRPAAMISEDVQAMIERDANYKRQMAEADAAETRVAEEQPAPIRRATEVYGVVESQQMVLDVYLPVEDGDARRPAVLLFHAGAGKFGDRHAEADRARGLAANGYVAYTIAYRLLRDSGANAWPAQLEDAQLAVRWVRANADKYNVDPDRICSLGHSFGGLLAAQLGVRDTVNDDDLPLGEHSSKVGCVITIAAGLDATHPYVDNMVNVEMALYGGAPSETPEIHRDASPLHQVDSETVPFLIFHGADDENTSVEESRKMVDALHRAGVEVVYVEYPHAPHLYWINYFAIVGSWKTVAGYTLPFLERHLGEESAEE